MSFGIASSLDRESRNHHRSSRKRHPKRHRHSDPPPRNGRRMRVHASVDERRAIYYDERPGAPYMVYFIWTMVGLVVGVFCLSFVVPELFEVLALVFWAMILCWPLVFIVMAIIGIASYFTCRRTPYRRPTHNGIQHWD